MVGGRAPAGSLGSGIAAGARSRSARRADHEARRDALAADDVPGAFDTRAARGADAASRTRPSSTSRSIAGVPTDADGDRAGRPPRSWRATHPTPTRSRESPNCCGVRTPGPAHRRRRLLGRRRDRAPRARRGGHAPGLRQRHGPGHARRPTIRSASRGLARSLSETPTWSWSRARRSTSGSPSVGSRTRPWSTSSTHRARSRPTPTSRRRPSVICGRRSARWWSGGRVSGAGGARTALRLGRRGSATRSSATRRVRRRRDSHRTLSPIDPVRGSTASCGARLERDAIVVGDGGDFVSYAGSTSTRTRPAASSVRVRTAAWDRGPGTRSRRRWRIRIARPSCSTATARSASASATSTRSPVTARTSSAIVGNNGIWGLEKHPMQAALRLRRDLRPRTRYALRPRAAGPRVPRRARRPTRPSSVPRSTARSRTTARPSSTCSPTRPTPTHARATSADPRAPTIKVASEEPRIPRRSDAPFMSGRITSGRSAGRRRCR